MQKVFQRITSLLLILGLLVSSTGIGIAKHYCGGALKDVVLYSNSCCCAVDAQEAASESAALSACDVQSAELPSAGASCCAEPVPITTVSSCCGVTTQNPGGEELHSECCDVQMELVKVDLAARHITTQNIEIDQLVCLAVLKLRAAELGLTSNIAALDHGAIDGPAPLMQGRSLNIVQQTFLL